MKKMFANKKVLIFGLGLHGGGVGSARFFAEQGALVTVTDLKTEKMLASSLGKLSRFKNIRYVLGHHEKSDFVGQDMVVVGPGIPANSPYLRVAKKSGAEITSDIIILFRYCKAPIYGVTGTKGKTTTTTLLYEIMKKHKKTYLGGNVRVSVLDFIHKATKKDAVVLELSSFQLEGLHDVAMSPKGAIITNLSADHMDRYASLSAYFRAKYSIFQYQKKNDVVVLNADDSAVRKAARNARSRVLWFSSKTPVDNGVFRDSETVYVSKGGKRTPLLRVSDIALQGDHNKHNALAAITLTLALHVPKKKIVAAVKAFAGVSGRLEKIRTFQSRTFFNDTTATVPIATQKALESFDKPVVLIAGGSEKNLSFSQLAKVIPKKVSFLVLMDDVASYRLLKEVKKNDRKIDYAFAKNMKQAVDLAVRNSAQGDAVLLSPACASFGLFNNEFDRGDQFVAAVRALKK